MAPKGDRSPSPLGMLSEESLADLELYREFLRCRDLSFRQFLGRNLPRSHLRDELIREVMIEYGRGRLHGISYYQRMARHLGSPTATRNELLLLADLGVVVIGGNAEDRRVAMVQPTVRLVYWYSQQLPKLADEVLRLIKERRRQYPKR